MGPFEVTKELVGQLDDRQLRLLLERLLVAEANAGGISHFGIAVGGSQTAADGGVDGSIEWDGPPEPCDWLPRRRIYFQCKAEAMGPAKIRDEMRPGDSPRAIFTELAERSGAYIIFSTDDPTKSALDDRKRAMSKGVMDVAEADRIKLDFYSAERIARWANRHPGVAIWLLGQSGRALGGWRPHGDWSALGSEAEPYLIDEIARATMRDKLVDIGSAIAEMRAALATPGGVVRLVGLSGMGKTRMAQALFDERCGENALSKGKAIYSDAGRDLEVGAVRVAEELVLAGAEAIMVVDNANVNTHAQLAEIASRPGSRLSVMTVDYDMGGEKPAGLLVALGENSKELLGSLLEQRCPMLSEAECRHLAEFSGGNARVALKIAEGAEKGVDLSKLDDGELIERLFQSGRQEKYPSSRASAEAAALVYAFYAESGDRQEVEYPVLAAIAGVDREKFFRQIATFLEWGIAQQRGPQRAIMPPPFANMLAAPFIRRSSPQTLLKYFLDASPRLLASFARRLGQLHDEPAAVSLASFLLGPEGPFGEPALLSDIMRRGFANMAPCASGATLAAFERALAGSQRSKLLAPDAEGRQDYVELLVHLAHDASHFARALEILLAFALEDGDESDSSSAKKHLLERFWPELSFTLADQPLRLEFIDRMNDDPSPRVRSLGLEALDHMLEAGHFSSSLNLEFGSKVISREWRPRGLPGLESWFGDAYDRVTKIAVADPALAERARDIVASHFREHLDAHVGNLAVSAVCAVRGEGYWDAGWRAVTDGLSFSRNGLTDDMLAAVRALERDLRPKSLDECFDAFVIGEPWRHWLPERRNERSTRDVGKLAEATGKCIARYGDPSAYLARAIEAEGQNSVGRFARGVARIDQSASDLWHSARDAFAACTTDSRNPAVLEGLLETIGKRDRALVEDWLEAAVSDPVLGEHIVPLHLALELDEAAMERFAAAIDHGSVPLWRFAHLQMGGVSKPVPGAALARLLKKLYDLDEGRLSAIQTLHMRIYGDRSDKRAVDLALVELGREFLADERTYSEQSAREDYALATIANVCLMGGEAEKAAAATCRALRDDSSGENYYKSEFDKVCRLLMERFPRIVLDEVVAHDVRRGLASRFFGGHVRNDVDGRRKSAPRFDEDVALAWVLEDAASRAAILSELVPYTAQDEESGLLTWSPFAMKLIEAPDDPVPVLRIFETRFFTGSSSGPFSARFVRRRPLVAAMRAHDDVRVRNWAREAAKRLEENIRQWDERDRDRESRFE